MRTICLTLYLLSSICIYAQTDKPLAEQQNNFKAILNDTSIYELIPRAFDVNDSIYLDSITGEIRINFSDETASYWIVEKERKDTLKPAWTNFFGSDCDLDTLTLTTNDSKLIMLSKNENTLSMTKNDRTKWIINFGDSISLSYQCVIMKAISKRQIVIRVYDDNNQTNYLINTKTGELKLE